jgi:hypothetical protein
MVSWIRATASVSASSQVTCRNSPAPLAPVRTIGCRIRSSPYMCSGKARTLPQMNPAVNGSRWSPSTLVIRPSSTVTCSRQVSGQSIGQAEECTVAPMPATVPCAGYPLRPEAGLR